uniref:Radical S-adenosyl methionine domain-containing protein n=1 Tax=Geotrypetes seraphini TaxID=260995 RepID=A0A6P8SG82_GEOSA|nr:radical S-adenosyl methionine domain-containing protein 1, mitochondrial [Geotrypetes seraphini]
MVPGQLCWVCPRFSLLSNIWKRSVVVRELVVPQWPSGKRPGSRECSTWTDQAALYVHWPYCQKRCSYCNFNKYIARNVDEEVMKQCLVQEAGTLIQLSQVSRISSVFFGGGTPSLASPSTIAAILESVSKHAHLAGDAEVTLEVNPTSAEASHLAGFRLAGVNRLSIGIQSLDDTDLRLLGRNHTALDSLRTLKEARRLFPGATSVDVIFGLPGQTVTSWVGTLKELLGLCDDHVSLYQLTLERGTALFAEVQNGLLSRPEPEVLAEMYEAARQILRSERFRQYEVSNFARNGALCIHNQSYWQGHQYIGIGPGAHGRFVPQKEGKSRREARIQTLEPDPWMREVISLGHGTRKRTEQSKLDVLEEVLVTGLRMDVGVTHEHWQQFMPNLTLWNAFGTSQEVRALEEQGFLLLDDSGLRCSWKGLAVLDSLLPTLLNQLQQSWVDRAQQGV